MSANISLVMHSIFVVAVATLGFSLACACIAIAFLRWSNRFNPYSRLFLLRLFAAWPLLGGLAIGVMVSLPSINHASKLPFDHCHNSGGCVMQPVSHMLSIGEFTLFIALLGFIFWAAASALSQWRRARALADSIETMSHATLAPDIHVVGATQPLAFSVGLFKPVAALSTELVRLLTPQQLDIICGHEQAHLRHYDNGYKWALRLLCAFHWPQVKRALLSEHAVTLELRADQQVAEDIQDPIAVAETIVIMQRIIKPLKTSEPLCQFVGSTLERRVQCLLAYSSGHQLPKYSAAFFLITAIVIIISGAVPLHNTLEYLLT
jgi:hypothetical protein